MELNDRGGDGGRKLTDLYYEFAPLLMHEVPYQTVTLLMGVTISTFIFIAINFFDYCKIYIFKE